MTRRDRQLAAGLATAFLAGDWTAAGLEWRAQGSVVNASVALRTLVAETIAAYRDPPQDRPRELAAFLLALDAWSSFAHPAPTPVVDAGDAGDDLATTDDLATADEVSLTTEPTAQPTFLLVFDDSDLGEPGFGEPDSDEPAPDPARADPPIEAPIRPVVERWTPTLTAMGRTRWPITELGDLSALQRLFDIDAGELAWLADVRGLERTADEPLRHYRWRVLPKQGGARLVAAPKPRLKEAQRRLLRHVINPIPPHSAAQGGVRGSSVRTAVAPHTGQECVIRLDIEAFFFSITAPRIWGVLRSAGLPEAVAHSITGLVTTVVPRKVWSDFPAAGAGEDPAIRRRLGERLAVPQLPQGAPTSPGLANLVAFTLDRRLAGLAANFGANYTRYVDDLTFSGGVQLRAGRSRFVELATDVLRSEGFAVNERKTVVLGDAGRQHVLGAVVNQHPTLPRPERDALRAVLHNCAVQGWRTQCREHSQDTFPAYLLGRISWANSLDPRFGARLRAAYDQIDWT